MSFLINIQKGKEFNLSAMVGIQGGREGKMGVKTFILQRVQPPLCLRELRVSVSDIFAAIRWNTWCPQRLCPFWIAKFNKHFSFMSQFISSARFTNGRVQGLFWQIFNSTTDRFHQDSIRWNRAPRVGDGGEERGPDPWLYQASVNRGDTRFRGLGKGRRGSKVTHRFLG